MSGWSVGEGGVWKPADLFGVANGGLRHPLEPYGVAQSGVRHPTGQPSGSTSGFVTRDGADLLLDGEPYKFVGFNTFGLTGCEGPAWSRSFINTYFAALLPNSMTRMWAFETWGTSTLDQVVESAEDNGQKLCLVLNNALNDCVNDGAKASSWYSSGYLSGSFLSWCNTVADRYKNSPAIGMYECINEAGQGLGTPLDGTVMYNFFQTVASTIKSAAPNHLVGTGDNARYNYTAGADQGLTHWTTANSAPALDVCSIHDYESDFIGSPPSISSHFAPMKTAADSLGKPIIVGELGDSACSITKQARADTVKTSIDDFFTAGAKGVLIWNYSDHYYNTCPGGNDYILVDSDPLTSYVRNYVFA